MPAVPRVLVLIKIHVDSDLNAAVIIMMMVLRGGDRGTDVHDGMHVPRCRWTGENTG
ncbi:MAG: hypothetical protein ACK4SZ_14070 [Allosphingosinicella sp.]|uniref:hypothetical protein n=1 Tax=Allosphingosinicella sp. TaxID=2823234 RepID=UPI003955109D